MIYRKPNGRFCSKAWYKIHVEQKDIPYMERDFSVLKGYIVKYNVSTIHEVSVWGDVLECFVANIDPKIGISIVKFNDQDYEICCIRFGIENYETAFKCLVSKIIRGSLKQGLITDVVKKQKNSHVLGRMIRISGSPTCAFK